jgi:hypothetical protein
MIGKIMTPTLLGLEGALIEFEAKFNQKPEFPDEAFRAATKIFFSALGEKMFELQQDEKMSQKDCLKMAENCGNELRKLIKTFTNIDSHNFYQTERKTH